MKKTVTLTFDRTDHLVDLLHLYDLSVDDETPDTTTERVHAVHFLVDQLAGYVRIAKEDILSLNHYSWFYQPGGLTYWQGLSNAMEHLSNEIDEVCALYEQVFLSHQDK